MYTGRLRGFWASVVLVLAMVQLHSPRGGAFSRIVIEFCAVIGVVAGALIFCDLITRRSARPSAQPMPWSEAPRRQEAGRVSPPDPRRMRDLRDVRDGHTDAAPPPFASTGSHARRMPAAHRHAPRPRRPVPMDGTDTRPDPSATARPRPSLIAPLFGTRGSRAHGRPWLLPARPVHPGVSADAVRLGDLEVRAASIVGPGHRCEEPAMPRQDAYRLGRDDDGRFLVLAVADGVSSSAHAERGATVAASVAVNAVRDRLAGPDPLPVLSAPELFVTVADQMVNDASRQGLEPGDVAAVLVVAVIPAYPEHDLSRDVWVGWLGDVSAWTLGGGRWSFQAGDRKGGAGGIESNSPGAVLPAAPQCAEHRWVRLGQGDVISFVTDGFGDALATIGKATAFLAEHWAEPPPVGEYLGHVGFDAEQFLDDRTAVTVWPDAGTPSRWAP
ncbi:protein phosphatase 2C domain-containing protein [Spirillospora sp. NPDC048911]|uniref:protein phosphatase 2C domain-containing protein n=1 Tax=Spirillospora sp. NPDC048911 TaxID=3364527 RepID=UPI00371A6B3A